MVRHTLIDNAANVRSAAARAFQSLQEAFGARAIDETIPTLLAALRHPGENSDTALQALREVMNVRHFFPRCLSAIDVANRYGQPLYFRFSSQRCLPNQ